MINRLRKNMRFLARAVFLAGLAGAILACGPQVRAMEAPDAAFGVMTGKLTLEQDKGYVRSDVRFHAEGLAPGQDVQLIWMTVQGSYKLEGIYSFIRPEYKEFGEILLEGKADAEGRWDGTFRVPNEFGGDHTIYIRQDGRHVAQSGYFVEPRFTMSPSSGPVGTEITIRAEGLGWSDMESNWQLTYDNKMTGLISAVSTNGTAEAKIRAAGPAGRHTLTLWHGYLGMPYINHRQAPTSYLPVPSFTFEVTGEPSAPRNMVEPLPTAADGGVSMPAPRNKPGVEVSLDKDSGIVGEPITLTAKGLPAGQPVDLVWHTMTGNRVTAAGFSEKPIPLSRVTADGEGSLSHTFPIPDDLGGVPHRIDLRIGDEVYGQAYLGIVPSIASMTPLQGPAGTEITIELKGVGWTEYDNAYYLTYDNAYVGYMCGFNSQGTVRFTIIASGEPGYHLIDLYPGIYRGRKADPDIYTAPQLTYGKDHPGTAIPAIRLGFQLTE
jgi:hypothetical protein